MREPSRRFSRQSLIWCGLFLLVVFRMWFAAVLPMTGDEAYFVLWGEHPAGGYYDHPPMVGWWLSGLLLLSRASWLLRLPAVWLPLLLAYGAWWLVRPQGAERARYAALLVLLQPVNVWNVLITTDTPVILFSMLSIMAYVAALRRAASPAKGLFWHGMAGALLGAAFLGKYFAALLGAAFLAHVCLFRRDARRWRGFFVLLATALPAPLYNLWWNSGHCWVNILFNFINRNEGAAASWSNPLLYLASLLYLATPWLIVALWRHRAGLADGVRRMPEALAACCLLGVPLALFALLSLGRPVGLHWMVSFIPLFAVLAAMLLPVATLLRLTRCSAWFAAAHVVLFALLVALPLQTWKNIRLYDGIVLTARTDEVLAQIRPHADNALLAMEGYSPAAILAYAARRPVAVFGQGSVYARQDDFVTDWRTQDGRDLAILRRSAPREADYAGFFHHVEYRSFDLQGVRFWLILGRGFDYAAYREQVLRRIRARYYRIPERLPQRGCEFCQRYFPDEP